MSVGAGNGPSNGPVFRHVQRVDMGDGSLATCSSFYSISFASFYPLIATFRKTMEILKTRQQLAMVAEASPHSGERASQHLRRKGRARARHARWALLYIWVHGDAQWSRPLSRTDSHVL
jgi:hypothetical protein